MTQFNLSNRRPESDRYWGIILAGGDGKRVQDFLRTHFGLDKPKQFCALLGKRSMLRHTIDRASSLIPRSRLVTVIGRRHLSFAKDDLFDREPQSVVLQPLNCETAPGILLPLARIHSVDPKAIIAIFPADHFILEERRFMEYIAGAFTFVARTPGLIVTLGVRPASLQPGYGWIERGDCVGQVKGKNIFHVKKFWEKPAHELTQFLFEKGCLWNTMTLVGTAEMFVRLFRECTPEMFSSFQKIWKSIGTTREEEAAEEVFRSLPSVNFSRAILERASHSLGVLPVKDVYWSDWGDETRIRIDLARMHHYQHLTPGFSRTGQGSQDFTVATQAARKPDQSEIFNN